VDGRDRDSEHFKGLWKMGMVLVGKGAEEEEEEEDRRKITRTGRCLMSQMYFGRRLLTAS
jgi:hypothetical protein